MEELENTSRGGAVMEARQAHNLEVAGSTPAPAACEANEPRESQAAISGISDAAAERNADCDRHLGDTLVGACSPGCLCVSCRFPGIVDFRLRKYVQNREELDTWMRHFWGLNFEATIAARGPGDTVDEMQVNKPIDETQADRAAIEYTLTQTQPGRGAMKSPTVIVTVRMPPALRAGLKLLAAEQDSSMNVLVQALILGAIVTSPTATQRMRSCEGGSELLDPWLRAHALLRPPESPPELPPAA